MRRFRLLLTFSIQVFTMMVSVAYGQSTDRPLVLFIEGRDISTSSITNVGDAGASNLQQILVDLDVRVQRITLNEAIPDDADLVVLLGPLRRLFPAQVARLWVYLHQGGNLLLAVDPDNQNVGTVNVRHQIGNSGLTALLDHEYGIVVGDTFVADHWFTSDSIADFNRTYTLVYPDTVPNDILTPLVEYDLPVWTWGARHLQVEPFGINGMATPLLYTDTAYGESNPDIFPDARGSTDTIPAPLELNLPEDVVGRLNVAASGENRRTGSRVLVLGDSEMLQNGYGLQLIGDAPRYPGNYVFAQRAIEWLLRMDPSEWSPLPQGLNWIKMDGSGTDWEGSGRIVSDNDTFTAPPAVDIQQIRTFVDDQFLYLLVETTQPPSPDISAQIQFDTNNDGGIDATIFVNHAGTQVTSGDGDPVDVLDAIVAYGDGLELRIPYRVVPPQQGIDGVCLSLGEQDMDCLTQTIDIPLVTSRAVSDPILEDHLMVIVNSINRVNLRRSPDTAQPPTTTIAKGTVLAALGRDEAGEWVYVENGHDVGWVTTSLLAPNGDLMLLPIVDAP